MDVNQVILFFTGLLLLALLVEPLARMIHLPFSAALVVAGFAGSELLVASGIDLGLRWYHFHDLVFFVLLPILIFEAAFSMHLRVLIANLVPVFFLAIPLMLLSAGITAVAVYYGIGHAQGFPWIAALLTGALLSATDPVAVVDLFRKVGAPERLLILVDGESLFNDAAAIVLFGLLLSMATMSAEDITVGYAIVRFGTVFLGGIATGLIVGGLGWLVFQLTSQTVVRGVVTIISAYAAFLVAEDLLHVSGVMAALIAGLILGEASRRNVARDERFLDQLWEFNAWIANALIFLLVGVTVTVGMFTERWLAILIGIAAVIIARAIGIFGIFPLVSKIPGVEPISPAYHRLLFWGGLRGAVVLALALSLPVELEYWWTIQAIAYGVVLFTLFILAPSMPLMMRKSGLVE